MTGTVDERTWTVMAEPPQEQKKGTKTAFQRFTARFKKNGIAPKDTSDSKGEESQMPESKIGNFFRTLILYKLLGRKPPDPSAEPEPPKTWKERLTYVADNAKGDKDAPSYFRGYFRGYLAFDSGADYYYKWLMIINLAVMYNLVFVIGRSVFWEMDNLFPRGWLVLDYFCDFLYVADIFVRMHEGYLEQGLMVKDAKLLRKNYIKGSYFLMDMISILPTDFAYFLFPSKCHENVPCPVIFRLNRVARLDRMFEFFSKTETRTNFPNAFRITKVIVNILILIHWNACFFFTISFAIGFETDGWVYHGSSSLADQYVYSFYWSTITLTTIGETPQPVQDIEYVFVTFNFLMGVLVFATIVGNIGSMITNMNADRAAFSNKMDAIKQYMVFRKVGGELESRVIKWFDYLWTNKQSMDEESILGMLPDKLKAEIAMHVHLETLKKVRIFQECERGLLTELVLKLKLEVFSPGDYVCRKGDVGKEMYIIKRGKLDVVSEDGSKVFVTLGDGVVFGELSILNVPGSKMGNRRTANVRSKGYSDLFSLNKDDLWDALNEYPDAKKLLLSIGREILAKDNMIDEEKAKREEAAQMTAEQKIAQMNEQIGGLSTRFGRLTGQMAGFQESSMQRMMTTEGTSDKDQESK